MAWHILTHIWTLWRFCPAIPPDPTQMTLTTPENEPIIVQKMRASNSE